MKPAINIKRLVMWEMTNESENEYGEVMPLVKRLMTYKDSVSVSDAKLYGDGVLVTTVSRQSSGTLELGIHGLTSEERKTIYGESVVNGTNVTTATDSPSYVAVALMSENADGTVNVRKWFKVRFKPHDESVTQISNESITFATPTISGTYIVNSADYLRAFKDNVDPATDAEFINKWFSEANYIGTPVTEAVNLEKIEE